ncbi:MAG: 16S rRNA (adenine(1518)-N(6)/adenine(1519)-N(6))-dimethyltransferase RsmA [Oscillospiraceae bacterium]|nr:16S rRNA (adenine(1518)-N(6)/adenine(1519)-N(6))-dimethyltransferase RsmA [Oscillospiraceae bacterium]
MSAPNRGFKYSKAMGQNFLIDDSVAERVAREARVDASWGVLEIGPGEGALTERLCAAVGRVVAVELDRRLLPALGRRLAGFGNAEVICGDILKPDVLRAAAEKLRGFRPAVCANLPYNITTPVITALLSSEVFETVTVMTQREVAARICARPGTPDCGAFSVFCQFYASCGILFDVPPTAFFPRPGVLSSVVRMEARAERAVGRDDEEMFFRVARAAFAQRRKTLVNALHSAFGRSFTKAELADALSSLGYGAAIRGETVDIAGFAAIASALRERDARFYTDLT